VSRIWSAVLVQTNGLGSVFHLLIHLRTSVSSSTTLRWAERRSLRLVNSANQRSARLSQELLVGVECRWNRGVADQPFLHLRGLVRGVVVQHQV
jgi:hypothetical protein